MGTLFSQQPRSYKTVYRKDVMETISIIQYMAHEKNISISDTIDILKLLEMRRSNDLYIDNGNAFDEQIGGIGEILNRYNDTQTL